MVLQPGSMLMAFLALSFSFSVSLFDVRTCLKASVSRILWGPKIKLLQSSALGLLDFFYYPWRHMFISCYALTWIRLRPKHDVDKKTSLKRKGYCDNSKDRIQFGFVLSHKIYIQSVRQDGGKPTWSSPLPRILKGRPGSAVVKCFLLTPSECDTSEGQAADRSAKLAGLRRLERSAPVFTNPLRQCGITEQVFSERPPKIQTFRDSFIQVK